MAQLTITIPDALLPVFQRFQDVNGVTWLDAYVTEKLKELDLRFLRSDGENAATKSHPLVRAIVEKWDTLPPQQQIAVLAIFGR